jgi:hypothetical protein
VFFEGAGMFLRPTGGGPGGLLGLAAATWGNFLTCAGLGAGIGADCWGVAEPAVRYDSPTWGGFRFETSYGKNQITGPGQAGVWLDPQASINNVALTYRGIDTSETDFWDIAAFYTGDWNSIKVSAAAAYTWIETGATTTGISCGSLTNSFVGSSVNAPVIAPVANFLCGEFLGNGISTGGDSVDLFQVGGSIMHKPSGLGIYGLYQHEDAGQNVNLNVLNGLGLGVDLTNILRVATNVPDTNVWYVKPFWRKAWSPVGATVLFGEYGQYDDMYGNLVGLSLTPILFTGAATFVTDSEVQRWGLGVVQEIDSAAMHLWLRWQHQELDVSTVSFDLTTADLPETRGKLNAEDWDLIQGGAIIFF